MATKRYTPLDDPPSASSDDDDDETEDDEQEIITQKSIHESSSSEEEEEEEDDDDDDDDEEEEEDESESEEEETPEFVKKSTNPQIQNPNPNLKLTLEPESGSDSKFESDLNSPTASGFAIKPSKKIKAFESPENTPTSKRVKKGNADVDDEKKAVIKRVWSVEDELMLLQGFIDYQLKTGCSPLSDMDGYYKFTMSSLPGYATKSQLYEKIRRLKKKFRVNSEKDVPVFGKLHEQKVFDLSSKIWGVNGCENVTGGSTAKAKVRVLKVKPKVEVKEKVEDDVKVVKAEDFETRYPYWNAGLVSEVSSGLKFPDGVVNLVKENLALIGEGKAKEMNEKWEAIFENEAVLRKRRIVLLSNVGGVETA
ncbi:STOREKEEPER protein-like [Bidens hawaiensis]|uniref:STOREKEEPER protein-like n=1 Tax=Bidens hawaiensis TaxID=980011 RepID=UPI004048EB94